MASEMKNNPVAKFPVSESVGDRAWGAEELLVLIPGKLMLKRLFVRAGSESCHLHLSPFRRCSRHHHHNV